MRIAKQGFTALELMVTMAIVAILLAAGVPTFKNYSWNLRMKTAMDALHSDLLLARRRAISLNRQTVICPAVSIDNCNTGGEWQNGWMVFTDLNADHQRQAVEPLLKSGSVVEFINISSSRGRSYLRFFPNGSAPGSNISILFCDQRGARYAGKVTVSNSGRIRLQTGGTKATKNCP